MSNELISIWTYFSSQQTLDKPYSFINQMPLGSQIWSILSRKATHLAQYF